MKIKITGYEDFIDITTFEVIDDEALNGVEFKVPSIFIPSIIGEFEDPYEAIGKVYDAYEMDAIVYPKTRVLNKTQ